MSGVGFAGRVVPEAEKTPELGRDSSVFSVILLRRAIGSERGIEAVGRELKLGRDV